MRQLLSSGFMPHGYCYLWDPWIVWLHVISDSLITLSYYWIPVLLVYVIRKQRDLSFNRIFWMFAVFIMACGATHFMEVWNIWHASYLLAGVLKAITAAASVVTALALVPLMPKIISAEGQVHLEEVNRKLKRQIAAQQKLDALSLDAPLRRTIAIGFVVAVLLTAVAGFLSWQGQRLAGRQVEANLRTASVIDLLERTMKDAVEVETGARGFSLTEQESFLEPFVAGQAALRADMAGLRQQTTNPDHRRRLETLQALVDSATAMAREAVVSRRLLHGPPGLALFRENKKRVDAVRAEVRTQLADHRRTLEANVRTAAATRRTTRGVTLAGSLVGICFMTLAVLAINREIRISAGARAQVWTLNATLEQKVEERTAALQAEIVERKRMEESHSLLAAVAESSDDAIASKTLEGIITAWNRGAERIFGYSASEIVGKPMLLLFPRELVEDEADILDRIRRGESVEHYETVRVRKDGTRIDVSVTISPIRDGSGTIVGASKIARDITRRKREEVVLQNSLETAERALKELADQKFALDQHALVAITDVQGTITYANEKFCAISQYSHDELLGQNHRILNSGHHPSEFFQEMYRVIANGQVWHGEIKNRAKDGSFYWVNTTIVPTLDADGKPRQYVAIRTDISERKWAQVALEEQKTDLARSNGDLEQFAYAASHDLQEPLRAVAGCMQLLQTRYKDKIDERANEFIFHAVDGASRMQHLIDDLLAFSRVGTRGGAMQPADCGEALARALKNLSTALEESGAQVDHDPLPMVYGDLPQLSLLFQNLLGNALKFRGDRAPQLQVRAQRDGDQWQISLSDNGIGISPEYFERIFVIFQRLHTRKEYPGTGMGLALCKKIVERHGGRIWVESETGKGTTFSFTLQAAAKAAGA